MISRGDRDRLTVTTYFRCDAGRLDGNDLRW